MTTPTTPPPATHAVRSCGCPDYDEARLALSRRALLGTALAGGAVALGPSLTGAGPRAYAVTGRSRVRAGRARRLGAGAAVPARRRRRALARRPARRPGLLRRASAHRRSPHTVAAGAGRDVRPAPGPGPAAADVGRRHAGRRARHRHGRRPTGRTSPPWRPSRTPLPARPSATAGSTACSGSCPATSPLQGTAMGNQVADLAVRHQPGLRRRPGRPAPRSPAPTRTGAGSPPSSTRGRGSSPMSRAVRDAISGAQTFGAARDTAGRRARDGLPRHGPGQGALRRLADRALRRRRRGDHRRPGRLGHAHRRGHRSSGAT